MNISNQEARAAAITAYEAYKINPEVAKEIMFNYENIREFNDRYSFFMTRYLSWSKSESISLEVFKHIALSLKNQLSTEQIRALPDKEVTDPGIKGYAKLIERVAEIDVEAAAWMLFEAPKMKIPEEFEYIGDLYDCFVWSDTPQGEDFWCELSNKLDYNI